MAAYRIYFTARRGSILGRHDFEARDDVAARRVALALFDACSDTCHPLDLWQGTRRIRVRRQHRSLGLADLSDDLQQIAIKTEEMIVQSEFTVAHSRRLIDRIERAHRERPSYRRMIRGQGILVSGDAKHAGTSRGKGILETQNQCTLPD